MLLQRYALSYRLLLACITIIAVLLQGALLPLAAQEMAVPIPTQWAFFQKILSFQRVLHSDNTARTPVLAIAYQSQFRPSLDARNEILSLFKELEPRISSGVVKVVEIDLTKETDLGIAMVEKKVTLLYVAPLRAYNILSIAKESRQKGVLTISGVPAYIAEGLSVGLDIRGNKPEILINRMAARLEGREFHAQLLKLATIIR